VLVPIVEKLTGSTELVVVVAVTPLPAKEKVPLPPVTLKLTLWPGATVAKAGVQLSVVVWPKAGIAAAAMTAAASERAREIDLNLFMRVLEKRPFVLCYLSSTFISI
jgi:hypothetical protein